MNKQTGYFYIISLFFDKLGLAVYELACSLQEEGFWLVVQSFMHRFFHIFIPIRTDLMEVKLTVDDLKGTAT